MRHLFALAVAFAVAVTPRPAPAQEPVPPIHVAVLGQPVTWKDIEAFLLGFYTQPPNSPQIKMIRKAPDAMPSDAPYVSYQGRDPGPPPTEIIWMTEASPTSNTDLAMDKAAEAEYVASVALAVMDASNAGPTLQAIYAKTPPDRASRLALANAFGAAVEAASEQAAAFSASEADWIRTHIVPGTTRSTAYGMLKSKGLTAYNWAFVKGKPTGAEGADGCEMRDRSSGAWPYKGEPLPKQEGACVQWFAYHPPKSVSNPEAQLELGGAFSLACDLSTYIEIQFNDGDRVSKVQIDKPRWMCL